MLPIDVFSDLICPWCFIGKRRLDRIAAQLEFPIEVRWRAYQLRPGLPLDGVDRLEVLQQRYGASARLDAVPERLREEAHLEGIELRYDRMARVPNTLPGHRLLAAAASDGVQHALADALFVAYFCAGEDLADQSVLARIGQEAGMSSAVIEEALHGEAWVAPVAEDLAAAVEHQVSGVPAMLLAGRYPLPGVQSDDVLLKVLRRAHERLT
ncbi:MAG: DsbA family oxidoreductase [Pseudomonadota bacterium]